MVDKNDCLNVFILMCEGMVKKDRNMLEEAMSIDSAMYHMTGKRESRSEYIKDILDGALNYYDYEIISFNENETRVRLLAKVYGGLKSWWTLLINTKYCVENNKIKIIESKVRLG